MTYIYDLTNLLRDVRSRYQAEYIDITEREKNELEILDRDYKAGSPTYTAKKQEIRLACDMAIIKAREITGCNVQLLHWQKKTESRLLIYRLILP